MKNTMWIIVIAVLILIAIVLVAARRDEELPGVTPTPSPFVSSTSAPTPAATVVVTATPAVSTAPASSPMSATVKYSAAGFAPATLRIKKDDSVIFRNTSQTTMWPASAMHPTHEAYPGSSIRKCGEPDEAAGRLFDACRAVKPGSNWMFRFTEVGTWNYHNHLDSSQRGTIRVEE